MVVNGFIEFQLVFFFLKMEFSLKNDKARRTCEFCDFVIFGWWNTHVYPNALICDICVYIVETFELICLVLTELLQLF